jgi:hypothetical protein
VGIEEDQPLKLGGKPTNNSCANAVGALRQPSYRRTSSSSFAKFAAVGCGIRVPERVPPPCDGEVGLKTFNYLAEVTARGGITGKKLEVVGYDNKLNAQETLVQLQKAIPQNS